MSLNILHQGMSNYAMRLDSADANLIFDSAKPADSKVEVSINAASLDVGDASVSSEFAERMLNAKQYPTIRFTSNRVVIESPQHWQVSGELSLNGIVKPETLAVVFNGTRPGMGMNAGKRLGFSASAVVKRSDFNIAQGMPPSMLGDDLAVHVEIEFEQKK